MNQGTAVFESLSRWPIQKTPEAGHNAALRTAGWAKSSWHSALQRRVSRLHSQATAVCTALAVADSHQRRAANARAYALLGMATVLSKRGAARDALSKQTEIPNYSAGPVLMPTRKTPRHVTNAAFALSEGVPSCIMGQFQMLN